MHRSSPALSDSQMEGSECEKKRKFLLGSECPSLLGSCIEVCGCLVPSPLLASGLLPQLPFLIIRKDAGVRVSGTRLLCGVTRYCCSQPTRSTTTSTLLLHVLQQRDYACIAHHEWHVRIYILHGSMHARARLHYCHFISLFSFRIKNGWGELDLSSTL
jgi:hypothetical protein